MVDFTKDMHRGQSPEQTQSYIEGSLKTVIMQATNQAADGCLKHDATEDKTTRIIARSTVLNIDTQVYEAGHNAKLAEQFDHHQHLLINTRREANALFESALERLSPQDKDNAVRVMNLIGEQIFKESLNKQEVHYVHSPEGQKNSAAELRVSEAKKIFAGQIESGAFLKNMASYASNGMQTQCVHKDADVVDYDYAPN
jgi:hypothetical protein